jgi:hypothetical protein
MSTKTSHALITPAQLALGFAILWFAIGHGTNVGLSVVLERSGAAALPGLMVLNAVVLAVGTATVSILGRGAALRSLTVSLLLAAALVGVFAIGERSHARWSATGLYVIGSIIGDLCVALFWSLANELFDARLAKQVFPRVGAAGTAGAALAGVLARVAGDALGTRGLTALWGASLLATAAWAIRTELRARTSLPAGVTPSPRMSRTRTKPPAQRADRTFVWALTLGFIVMTIVTYVGRCLYSWCLSDAYGTNAVAISKLNGLLNAIASVATALVQLFVAPLLLARWGIRRTMLVYPAALLLIFGLLVVHPGLAGGIAVFFATSVLRRAVQGPIENVLPTGLTAKDASRTVLLLTAVGTPVGMLLAGATLILGKAGQATSVAALGFVVSALLVAAGLWRAVAYRDALRIRLSKGGSDLHHRLLSRMASTEEMQSVLVEDLRPEDPALVKRLETLVRAQHEREGAPLGPWHAESALGKIALARLAEAYRLHASLERLPPGRSDDARWIGARELWVGSIRNRIKEDVRVVILVLRATTGNADLDRISRRVFDADARARAAAVEILDALCPQDLRPLLVPLVEQVGMAAAAQRANRQFGAPASDPIEELLAVPDPWIRACTAYALHWLDVKPYRARLIALRESADAFLQVAVEHALADATS